MIKNFIISSSVNLKFDGQEPDLHNCYRVQTITHCSQTRTFKIIFSQTYPPNAPTTLITLEFSNTAILSVSENIFNLKEPYLEEMGYKNPDDTDLDWLIEQRKSTPDDHLILRFCDDEYIRVYCDRATATAQHPELPPTR